VVRSDGRLRLAVTANVETLGRQADPAIVPFLGGTLLAWTDESGLVAGFGRSRVMWRRFDMAGVPIVTEAALNAPATSAREPALAVAGDRVLAVWTEDSELPFTRPRVVGRRLGGVVPDPASFVVSDVDGSEAHATALESGDFAVSWVGRSADALGDIRVRPIHAVGDPTIGTSTTTLTVTAAPHAELAPSVAGLAGPDALIAYESGGRRRGLATVELGTTPLAPEATLLPGYLTAGLQGDVTLLRTSRGVWFVWSDAGSLGDPAAHRSVLAFLLPLD
jgi:hypothetical protein